MEFFHSVNVDWMKHTKYFIALSLTLLAVGWISIARNGGLRLRHRFPRRHVRLCPFRQPPPPIDKIRKGLADAGLAQQHHSADQRHLRSHLEKRRGHRSRAARAQAIRRSTRASRPSSTCCTRPSAAIPAASPISIPFPPRLWPPTSLRKILSLLASLRGDRYNQLAQRSSMRATRSTAESSRILTS